MLRSRLQGTSIVTGVLVLTLVLVLLWSLLPVIWLVATSLKPARLANALPPDWTFLPDFENYANILQHGDFVPYLWNTVLVASVTSALATVFGTLSAYSFVRFNFRGSYLLPLFYLILRMVPRVVLVVPYFIIMGELGLLNTRTSLIVSYTTFALPFAIWLMIGFFKELPAEIEEAGLVDGATRIQVLLHIVVPVTAPGIATTALFAFLLGWNEFIFSLILAGPDSRTLPVLVAGFDTDRGILWGEMTAAATLIVLPVIVLAVVLQRHIVRGLTMGAVKG